MIWVVVTNSNTCRIYNYHKKTPQLILAKTLEDPQTRLRDSELVADKPGHYKSGFGGQGAYSPETDPKENEIANFARNVANELDLGRKTNVYDDLILITTPHMLGLLNHHLTKHTKDMISNTIQKDLQHLSDQELIGFLATHTKFRDNA